MVVVQKPALWQRIALCIAGFLFVCGIICFCIVGGFSLRSKAWIARAAELGNPEGKPEDMFQCCEHLEHFTSAGLKVAPLNLAMQFSAESRIGEFKNWTLEQSFGFHSWMMPGAERYCLSKPDRRQRWQTFKRRMLAEFLKHI